jgi:iron complex outermembrane receptor protein
MWHVDLTGAWRSNRIRAHVGFEQSNASITNFENNAQNSSIGINNQLLTLDVWVNWFRNNHYNWSSKFLYSHLNNQTKSLQNISNIRYQNIGAPGNGNLFYHEWQVGQPVSGLWANEYELQNGIYRVKDLNNNNNTEDDTRLRGQGIPRSWVSWVNKIRFYDFEIEWILRGVFGQSKVNEYRVFYENNTFNRTINAYRSSLYESNKPYIYNVLHVENASFVRLDNLALTYNFTIKKLSGSVAIGAQNLFTISKYTGLDPETRLFDIGATDNGNETFFNYNNVFSAGIDRRSLYPSTRNFFMGFVLQL